MNDIPKRFQETLTQQTSTQHGVGMWYVNLVEQYVVWDYKVKEIHEVEADYKPSFEEGINFYKEGESRDKISKLCEVLIAEGTPFSTELQIVTARGDEKWVRSVATPDFNEKGEVVGFYGTFEDIHDEIEQAQETMILKNRLEIATESAEIGIWDWDVQNNVLTWDDSMYNIYGIRKQDFSGDYEAWLESLHPEDKEASEKAVEKALLGDAEFHLTSRVIKGDGSVRVFRGRAKVYRDKAGTPLRMIGANWDVTEEEELKRNITEKNTTMLIAQEAMNMGIWKWYPKSDLAVWDEQMYALYDINPENKNPMSEWSKIVPESDVNDAWAMLGEMLEKGTPYNHRFSATVNGKPKYIKAKATVIKDSSGNIDYVLGINVDISKEYEQEQKVKIQNSELSALSEKLQKSNKRLEEFAYIASHDLKSPIRNMSNLADVLLEDYNEVLDEDGIEYLNIIQKQAASMTKLVNDLLAYSRVNKIDILPEPYNLNDLFTQVIDLLGYDINDDVKIDLGDLGEAIIDSVQFREVVNNLLTNAVKYNDADTKQIKVWRSGSKLMIQDNGIGIDEGDKEKVFTFFRRLHGKDEYGGGTGAGLAIVRSILERQKMSIDFTSAVGEGTTFVIDLNQG